MAYEKVYKLWLHNLNQLFQAWGGTVDELESLTGIEKKNLYCILKGSRQTHPSTLLKICKCFNSKLHQLINIPEEI